MATVEVHEGRAVLVRTGGAELRREAALLAAIAGPGVPEVVAVDADDDGPTTRLVTTVAPPLPLVAGELARVGAEVAAVLARAHAAGVVHGPLHDEHVLGRPGSVLLGGWDAAGPGDPATDVAEVGRLLVRHAAGDRSLLALAARATATGALGMAALAASLEGPAPPGLGLGRRPPLVAGGLIVAGALVVAGLVLAHRPPARSAPPAAIPRAPSSTAATTSTTAWPAHRVRVTGNVVERDGERWTIGRPGDVIVVGDWDCDGLSTPAVLRPATGQVWSFTSWSADATAGRTVATVPGATSVRVEPDGRCDRLEVLGADGRSTAVG